MPVNLSFKMSKWWEFEVGVGQGRGWWELGKAKYAEEEQDLRGEIQDESQLQWTTVGLKRSKSR